MLYSFEIDKDLRDALKRLREREGVIASAAIREAIRAWFAARGTPVGEAERQRGSKPRRRP